MSGQAPVGRTAKHRLVRLVAAAALPLAATGCWDGTQDGQQPTGAPSPSLVVPSLPDSHTLIRLLDGTFRNPESECTPVSPPRPAPSFTGCVVRGDLAELAGHRGRVVMMYVYPPADLTLADPEQTWEWADPATEWVSGTIEVLDESLPACGQWRYITVPAARRAVLCDERELQNVLDSQRRVALVSDQVLVLVHVTAEKEPGHGCDPLATPCPPIDEEGSAYVEPLAIDTARRMLAEAGA